MRTLISTLLLLALLSACGQKSPLFLPKIPPAATPTTPPAAKAATPAAAVPDTLTK
ncbi:MULTISPECIES: LPS translocon maturation chaperone LptM [unclassified Undibacterium]|uniref:LPS translocon maturation chaperone LptM n=1 Tax=unclassified Undibacterium TaxID=2630295 RepID=UPI002AC8F581|nr:MULTISPECIES: lipoprotein [unclassified Undibacterium]MEB0137529.1 lipoprotein [Undibacterium sp. CCC2.1]MEB0170806.1 lipoprotein [Undibacterium sp. CCC1.1]MEB0174758.1 lipoprotein [Undibacterium sp. CCC3.4]MEB0214094.1 lipoprotein [Undibacterium sp. 5I2]WPX44410.1 lipoprotein [Undibacterium sp. CCC3.4]